MYFKQPVTEVIDQRHSVRTFEEGALKKEIINNIKLYIEQETKQYKGIIHIQLIEHIEGEEKVKLGTYGVIKGANYYIAAACVEGSNALLTLGYVLEKIVLYCTSLGLGTVWLGGTYKKSQFAKAMQLGEKEEIKIVVPVGKEAAKKSFVAKLMGDNSKRRKEFSSIFFEETAGTPLTKKQAGQYEQALTMLQFAPSAVNGQPWRVIKQGDQIHFYMVNEKGFHEIDLGIGIAHFDMTIKEQGIEGEYVKQDPGIATPFTYVVSWNAKDVK